MSYLPCELNCHTTYSDGLYTVEGLLERAKNDGIILVALTDYGTRQGIAELQDGAVPAIGGACWKTDFGNMFVLGGIGVVDWRDATVENAFDKINQAKSHGAIIGLSHPSRRENEVLGGKQWRSIDYMEVWHGEFSPENTENEQSIKIWTDLLDKGYHIAATYGRHWNGKHKGHCGCTYLNIDGAVNEENAISAIRKGQTVASTGAKFFFRVHQWSNTYSIGETIRKGMTVFSFFTDIHAREENTDNEEIEYKSIKIITNGNRCVLEAAISERHVRLNVEPRHWYRAELWGTVDGKHRLMAVTSPVYCE